MTPRRVAKLVQFSGSYLNTEWARKFILGSLLQRYNPQSLTTVGSSAAGNSGEDASLDKELLHLQRSLSEVWSLPAQPLDAVSEGRILRLLARYATGEGVMSIEALTELSHVLSCIRGSPQRVESPIDMEELLLAIGYAKPGDNLRRVAFAGELQYPPSALAHMRAHLRDDMERDGSDPFDILRVVTHNPAYAIDSASTSEVDDAIGVYKDPVTGEECFVVYVSDATVYCPFDSPLEQLTARLLTTTTYLPEGVFFMLPKPIVDAATLREDRPCRTFDIRFQIDEVTGELKNYSVGVGWLHKLRRITYDEVQALYDEEAQVGNQHHHTERESTQASPAKREEGKKGMVASGGTSSCRPSWMTVEDESILRRIYRAAQKRYETRQLRAGDRFIHADLPEPLIKVGAGAQVLSVEDQIIGTRDARLAVAEMMIAANEVCSRVAQENHLSIPFRGTRELSLDHVAAKSYREPQGVVSVQSLDPQYVFFAEAMQRSIRQLSGVTRAVYFHTPIYHAGLDTHNYTHSTSPLRRYADMLVHHQLKVWLWRTSHCSSGGGVLHSAQKRSPVLIEQPIAEHTMATLCSMISSKQEQSSILQESSQRYWLLKHIKQNILTKSPHHRFICLVGDTRSVKCAPEYARFVVECSHDSPSQPDGGVHRTVPWAGRWKQRHHEYLYVSDIYITELQFAHVVLHSLPDVVVGAVVECEVREVHPTQGYLSLAIVKVWSGGDERRFEPLWKKCLLPSLDS
ncbi:mitochondrial exoribonuclease DSS-1 [Trypanosoma brucei equiperdum]|uniref:Mitochondrial exoribonuclease DSS-1 n=1 Tax=Trypanosoma brucei equiperdum TaxID=630700 RepID=A0A3L6L1K8_9TRYP|nr:mitochondrial exoribonuclease DSS-1 [Trypanosoma brucei equiperdum]